MKERHILSLTAGNNLFGMVAIIALERLIGQANSETATERAG